MITRIDNPLLMPNNQNQADERVIQLLKPPTLFYIRELSKIIDQDPEYLTFHSGSVSLRVKTLLGPEDKEWNVPDRQVVSIVKEAIVRLRSFEK